MAAKHSAALYTLDAPVSGLLNQINEMENQRRLTLMHVQEVELRAGHLRDEAEALGKESEFLKDKSQAFLRQIEVLNSESMQLSEQVKRGSETLDKAATEEPTLIVHAESLLRDAEHRLVGWNGQQETLRKVEEYWSADPSGCESINEALRQVEEELESLRAAEQKLLEAAASERAVAAAPAAAPVAHSIPFSSAASEAEKYNLECRLRNAASAVEDARTRANREVETLERERELIAARISELSQWLEVSEQARSQILEQIEQCEAACRSQRCARCQAKN